jgi:hypothetical protein
VLSFAEEFCSFEDDAAGCRAGSSGVGIVAVAVVAKGELLVGVLLK